MSVEAVDVILREGRSLRLRPPQRDDALADLALRLARLGDDLPEVAELDLNPVIGLPDGCVAVDGRVRILRPERVVRTKTPRIGADS